MSEKKFIWGTGRRKTSVARVRICEGSGKIIVNKKDMTTFFTIKQHQNTILAPLQATGVMEKYDIFANVNGGGITGQSGAIMLGIARALCKAEEELEAKLRKQGHMTRDSRMSERKKYGKKKARKSFQFSKR